MIHKTTAVSIRLTGMFSEHPVYITALLYTTLTQSNNKMYLKLLCKTERNTKLWR